MILAIDTATSAVGVALAATDGSVLAATELVQPKRHVESLVPLIQLLCGHAGVVLADVTALAVDTGPGLFTGLRVGVATAKTLAQALGVGIVGVGSLEALAVATAPWEGTVASLVDARRGEVYAAVHRLGGAGLECVAEPWVAPPADVAAAVGAAGASLAVGDALPRYTDAFARCGLRDAGAAHRHPSAAAVARLAAARLAGHPGAAVDPAALGLLYLRPPDAQIRWETR